ncbi:biotin synthase BioB [Desulforamulus aeronauticus]|uniref:Biotin synthase n=1 Tax=Desulforamulus aeronauticus DSM 10349 TaxID=1121421 RepID=A0A1M6VVV4_9FIRM|nr:biotin synthase BioB [Desulforamulus aeronauticus]SHK85590.1 biotin synthase [Desulforamulus aeronauticus DSM 10349]
MSKILKHVEKKLHNGRLIDFEEAIELSEASLEIEELFHLADKICKKHMGNKVDLCAIINAKSGKCAENCKYCAQSGHYNTGIPSYPLLDIQDVLVSAKENEKEGVHRFSIVTSGGNLSEDDFEKVLQMIVSLRSETNLRLCASLGSLSVNQALRLKEAGLSMYHHNIETCREYYANICDSHTYDDRIHTIKNAIMAGLTVCCGGIIGMGEGMKQRIKMAFELRELGIISIPINILNPIKGTPLEYAEKIEPLEIVKTISLFRLIIPYAFIRYAGGRNALGELQRKGFMAGINGVMVGNYLTTVGNTVSDDVEMIREIGLEVCR